MSDPRAARAARLRSLGYTYQEIADRLGVSVSTARRLADPASAERQRAFARAWKRQQYCPHDCPRAPRPLYPYRTYYDPCDTGKCRYCGQPLPTPAPMRAKHKRVKSDAR